MSMSHDSPRFADITYQNPRDFAQMGPSEGYHAYRESCACFRCMKETRATRAKRLAVIRACRLLPRIHALPPEAAQCIAQRIANETA